MGFLSFIQQLLASFGPRPVSPQPSAEHPPEAPPTPQVEPSVPVVVTPGSPVVIQPTPPAVIIPTPVDLRTTASQKHVYGKRTWASVTGITLHQTACVLGERPARWETVGCHVGVTRGGRRIWLHDFDKLVVHGNGWNTATVGIEIDGLYAGVEGDPSTVWNDPTTSAREVGMNITPEMVIAAKDAVRWIVETVAAHGGHVRALVAHRQASENRRNDPGSGIWQQVALPLHEELGLSDGGIGFKLGTGYAIPERWDPRCKGIKY